MLPLPGSPPPPIGPPVWSVRSVRRGSSVSSGLTHFCFLLESGGAGCGGSPLSGRCCGSMGAVSRREAVRRVPIRPPPVTRTTPGARRRIPRKKPSDVPKRDTRRHARVLSRSCHKVASLFVYRCHPLRRPMKVSARAGTRRLGTEGPGCPAHLGYVAVRLGGPRLCSYSRSGSGSDTARRNLSNVQAICPM